MSPVMLAGRRPVIGQRMRLFTHNFLQCHVKNCTSDNFPLAISDAEIEVRESEYNAEFMQGYLAKLDYPALLETVRSVTRRGVGG